ncbi:MAG: hypothetical protein HY318_19195, partial [Armatimonadetes bacterium]|nr:hypothetical protein [Armatimonadota bacterium]
MKSSMAAFLVALGLTVCAGSVVAAQALPLVREVRFLPLQAGDPPSVVIPQVTGAVVVDGKLDEPAWKTAKVVDHFLLYPTKTPDLRRTRVLLMYDNENLYLGMEIYGDDNGHLRLVDQKEPDVWGGHMVEVWLATSARADDMFHLCLNARGSRYDETLKQGASWQGRWQGKGSVQADRWTTEIAFPFTEVHLSSPPTGGPWLVNFARTGERDASWTGVWEDAPRFGRLFFGADPGTGRSPAIEMILDREEYDPLDVTGVALVKVERGNESLAGLKVQLEVIDKEKRVLHSFRVDRLLKEGLDLTLDMTGIPPGVYRLKASLIGPTNGVLATAEYPLRKLVKRKQLPEPARGRIPLHVWKAETDQTEHWLITTGIPFPQGVLPSGDHVRLLDERGREVPCQTAVRSEWNRQGSVRWLGLDFPGRLTARGTNYTLEYGRKVRPRKTKTALAIEERGNEVRVNTGPLSFLVRKRGFNLLDEVKLNGQLLVQQEAGSGLELVDHEGATYTAANDPDTQVTLEERGPLKVVLRAEGWYVKNGTEGARVSPTLPTDRLCQHITRITAYAGQPYVRIQHVWIVTFDTSRVRLRSVGIGLNVPGAGEAVFGLDAQRRTLPFPLPPSVRLYQPSSEKAVLETDGEQEGTYRTFFAGRRSDGWFSVKGTKG